MARSTSTRAKYETDRPADAALVERYLKEVAYRNPATRVLTPEDIEWGQAHGTGWSSAWMFEQILTSLDRTSVAAPPLWLRDGEVYLHTYPRHENEGERHCRWTRDSEDRTECGKAVVHVRIIWGAECWGGEGASHYEYNRGFWIDSWRHTDGTPLHSHHDYGKEYFEPQGCEPKPMCMGCGQEYPWLESHCSRCHVTGALKTRMLAYGNQTDCSTPGCGYENYFSIGD